MVQGKEHFQGERKRVKCANAVRDIALGVSLVAPRAYGFDGGKCIHLVYCFIIHRFDNSSCGAKSFNLPNPPFFGPDFAPGQAPWVVVNQGFDQTKVSNDKGIPGDHFV